MYNSSSSMCLSCSKTPIKMCKNLSKKKKSESLPWQQHIKAHLNYQVVALLNSSPEQTENTALKCAKDSAVS